MARGPSPPRPVWAGRLRQTSQRKRRASANPEESGDSVHLARSRRRSIRDIARVAAAPARPTRAARAARAARTTTPEVKVRVLWRRMTHPSDGASLMCNRGIVRIGPSSRRNPTGTSTSPTGIQYTSSPDTAQSALAGAIARERSPTGAGPEPGTRELSGPLESRSKSRLKKGSCRSIRSPSVELHSA